MSVPKKSKARIEGLYSNSEKRWMRGHVTKEVLQISSRLRGSQTSSQRTVLTAVTFPNDLNTISNTPYEILSIKTCSEGLVPTYFDNTRSRIDPVVNVFTFFCLNGRGYELPEALDWIHTVLRARSAFPPAMPSSTSSRASSRCPRPCVSVSANSSPSACRSVAAFVGVSAARDYERLLATQEEEGSWPVGWMYKYGLGGVRIGNKGLTTAMAVAAIRVWGSDMLVVTIDL
ncbi:hypothetical protein LXA43DRAFT_1095827 [Ganoderma leucocontextum]|nr:hypothetical protein LXA43DRAFT_1095827 [Ganoderma leucocontextum]